MSVTIIKIQDVNISGDSQNFFSVRSQASPSGALQALDDSQFSVELINLAKHIDDPQVETDVILKAGSALNNALNMDANYHAAINGTLRSQVTNSDRQLQVEISYTALNAHRVPWEILVRENKFIATDKRVPIIRRVAEQKDNAGNFPNNIVATNPGLKILSVLAAESIDASGELDALADAVNQSNLPMSLLVLVADHGELKNSIDAMTWRTGVNVVCETVPRFKSDFENRILKFGPQICHLFCHGVSTPVPTLIIENLDGNLELSVADIAHCLLPSAWLVSLNACSGGQVSNGQDGTPESDTVSLAYDLAYEGIPFVVGMRKALPTLSSRRFTAGFLPKAFQKVEEAMAKGVMVELDFAQCINNARSMIIGASSVPASKLVTRSQAWSVPTMTRRFEPLKVPGKFSSHKAHDMENKKAELRDKLGQIAELAEAIEDFPEAHRVVIQSKIDELKEDVGLLRAELL